MPFGEIAEGRGEGVLSTAGEEGEFGAGVAMAVGEAVVICVTVVGTTAAAVV